MTVYQWDYDDDLWQEWKDQVPRSKALGEAMEELMRADLEGRILEAGPEPQVEPHRNVEPEPEPEPVETAPEFDVDDLDLPGRGTLLDERRELVADCARYLWEHGEGRKSTFIDEFYDDRPAEYKTESGWWNAIGKGGLAQLAEQDDRIEKPDYEGTWRWVG